MTSKLLLTCLLCFHTTNGATLGEGQMGMTELIQMRNDLQDRLRTGVRINETEHDTWQLFKNLFLNTTIVYIKAEFEDIGNQLNSSWNTVTGCFDTLSSAKNTSWRSKSDDKNNKFKIHDECRANQPDADCNRTCARCKAYVTNLLSAGGGPPTGSILKGDGTDRVPVFNACDDPSCWGSFGDDVYNGTLTEWFKKYHDWHCTEDSDCPDGVTANQNLKPHDCWVNCTHQCSEQVGNWESNKTECDNDQDDFEDALCDLKKDVNTTCNTYTTCRQGDGGSNKGADQEYKDKKAGVQALEAVLQAEYQMVKSIICLIDLLLKPNDEAISDNDISSCAQYYPMPCPDLALCIPEVPSWDAHVNCECDKFPNAQNCACGDSTNPGWCDTSQCHTDVLGGGEECSVPNLSPALENCAAFEAKYYTGRTWYNSNGTCTSDDVVTPVMPQACTTDRAALRGCGP